MFKISSWRILSQNDLAAGMAYNTLAAGCSSGPVSAVTGIFGGGDDDDDEEEVAEVDDGRISIMSLEQQLTPDPRYAGAHR